MDRLLIFLLLFLLIVQRSTAYVRCYSCSSTTTKQCGDNFYLTSPDAKQCQGTCIKRRGTRDNNGVRTVEVTRGCVSQTTEKCYDEQFNGISVYSCTCNSNYCNKANVHQVSTLVLLLPLVTVIWICKFR